MIKIIDRLRQINMILYWKLKYRKKIKIGKGIRFRRRLKIIIEKDGFLEIGENNFFNHDCTITCLKNISIGNNNLFGENVKIYDHNHVFNGNERDLREKFKTNSILIGNSNWIGTNVVILKNSSIGDRNVIGAGVVLDEKVDSYNVVKTTNGISISKIEIRDSEKENE